ncbi:hypothetical protein FHY11_002222 [Xanthomonas arboricola]|uniref:hypothetical protein n=1 Tax=Xanthomonas euroxanthea TaxID=2259622 RepID=UPI00141B5303|nr:hypothetical protein [Xanthomonas euroxanthea]NIK08712.1 hypothetical protein [Xanthomonas euroxanthea]
MKDQFLLAAFTLLGVVIGGLVNYLSTTRSKDREWRLNLTREKILARQKLYTEFMVAAQALSLEATRTKLSDTKVFDTLMSIYAQVELVGSEPVVATAKKLCGHVLDAHSIDTPKSERLLHHEKTDFIKAVRDEICTLEEA